MTHEGQHHVSNLVSDLVEMAQATKRLPELERELAEARKIIERDGATIARLELKLQDRAVEIDDLRAKLRSAEVERDDAGFRQLEAEDKHVSLKAAIETALSGLGLSLAVTTGDTKEQVVRMTASEMAEWNAYGEYKAQEAKRAAEEAARPTPASTIPEPPQSAPSDYAASSTTVASTEGQSATDPTGASSGDTPSASSEPSPWSPIGSYSGADQAKGVSVLSDPILHGTTDASQLTSGSETAPDTSAPSQAGAPMPGKYIGKAYRSWPVYVSEADWCRGGGTTESYWEGREQYRNVQAGVA